jgi:hypothetical protein
MASLALGFVGTAVGGPIGGFIGASIGGLIDNMLFPQKQQGPRLSDLSVQVSTYGMMIPKLYGPENRITGNVIYSSGLIESSHKEKSGGKGGPSVSTQVYSYSVNMAVAFCDAQRKPVSAIKKIWANSKLIYSAGGDSGSGSVAPDPVSAGVWAELVFHDGDMAQMPDSLLEGALGMGNVPAYRGTAYVVIWGLQLADYGNRIPNLEFLIEADEEISVGEVLEDIVAASGIDPNTISSSSVVGSVRGYKIATQSSCTAAIQPLALAYNFDAAQVAGGLRFLGRGSGIKGLVPPRFLAGHQGGEARPELIHWTRAAETGMPEQATLSFSDPGRDYQVNAQVARRVAGSAQNNLSSEIPIVVDVALAAQLTDRMLWEAWNSRDTATFQGDDRLIDLIPGKVYLFETPAGLEPLRIKRKQRGANGVIAYEVARDRSEVYQSTRQGISAPAADNTVATPEPTDLMLIDAPILADADDNTGFYFVVDGQGVGWRGADVKRSSDGGSSYDSVQPAGRQSSIGTAEFLAGGVTDVFDNVNTLRVVMDDPTDQLDSATELAVLQGANACWLGPADGSPGEILQFKNADLVAPGTYELTGLLRGRLGTEWAVGLHGSGDRFVLLAAGAIYRPDFGPGDWNNIRPYKAVSLLTLDADAEVHNFSNTGEGKRPLSPVHIVGVTDPATGDTAVTWQRRSRLRQVGLAGPLPLGESVEAYEIDVIVGSVVVRTVTSSTPSIEYTAAERIADAGSGDMVQIAVYQMSDVRGRGRPGYAEI